MKIFIELPTWIGDAIMSTPAIENLLNLVIDPEITLLGSSASIEALKNHPNVSKTLVLEKNYVNLFKIINSNEKFDIFCSFRGSFRSKLIKLFISSDRKYQYDKNKYKIGHQVEKYNNFINDSFGVKTTSGSLLLYSRKKSKNKTKKILGLNPGASYGSAKRWYPKEFAKVAIELSIEYDDIVIFGSADEKDISDDIEKYLIKAKVSNYQNLAGKTSMQDLISQISILDMFVTGDSGPMHIAAAFQIPTISIFGPTKYEETSQWKNDKSQIVTKNLKCQPCMKRSCPLKHHDCMKKIRASDVLSAIKVIS
jgi:heptosyltransferase II